MSSYSTNIHLKMDYKLTFFLVAAFFIPVSNLCLVHVQACEHFTFLYLSLVQTAKEIYIKRKLEIMLCHV